MDTLTLVTEKEPIIAGSTQWKMRAHIAAGSYTSDGQGRILLSPDCVTAGEVGVWADSLITELQEIKRRAARLQWDNHPKNSANLRSE